MVGPFFWSSRDFGNKNTLIYDEDVFFCFFGLHLNSRTKTPQFSVKTFFVLVFTCIRGQKLRPFFWSSLKFGDKNSSIFGEDLFFWSSLTLLA